MTDVERNDNLLLDAEAMADGSLPAERVQALNDQFQTQASALSRMLDVARINAELRKSRLAAYRDLSLAREISRLHGSRPVGAR